MIMTGAERHRGAEGANPPRMPDALVRMAYERLRLIAAGKMRGERRGHLLQTTALVHEAYMRLLQEAGGDRSEGWTARQFLGAAAEAMRRILIEEARAAGRRKRGAGWGRVPLETIESAGRGAALDTLAVDQAVERLATVDPRMHEVVLLRYFAGLEIDQVAEVMGLSASTVDREWRCARLWLYEQLAGDPGPSVPKAADERH
jgi:RNA polymerase sigma-70 factor (ECF subfamily)